MSLSIIPKLSIDRFANFGAPKHCPKQRYCPRLYPLKGAPWYAELTHRTEFGSGKKKVQKSYLFTRFWCYIGNITNEYTRKTNEIESSR